MLKSVKYNCLIIIHSLLIITYCPIANAQLFIADQAEVFIDVNGILEINGDTEIQNGGTLTMNGQAIGIGGDLVQNGAFSNPNGQLKFTGIGTQEVSGDLAGTNAPFDLVIAQGDSNSDVHLQTNIEVNNSMEFVVGKITTDANEVYVKNDAADAITGHYVPNLTDGTYATNDRFVDGNLVREVTSGNDYIFPIGNTIDLYNPIQIENLSNNSGKITASFVTQALGAINFSNTIDCSIDNPPYSGSASSIIQFTSTDQIIEYDAMTGEGIWEINSTTNFDYEVVVYPNNANANINGSENSRYHLLKRSSAEDPASDWTGAALSGNACIHSNNYHEIVGAGFSSFSIFGIAKESNSILPVELVSFDLQNIDNRYFKLNWTTLSERHNQGFIVERSENGNEFTSIGFVQGAGDSNIEIHYLFEDKTALKNLQYYYRLKQLDWDGLFSYSAIEQGMLKADSFVGDIYPNPSKGKCYLSYHTTKVFQLLTISVFSATGQKVIELEKEVHKGPNQIEIDIAFLATGIYEVIFSTSDSLQTRRLLKL
ncbi:MAG: T9SS type A sorting domain-containing protein [Chitinophagales bacterium]|nr:T9SS type A sorting domain-containing protein [Chitinophagales bacterium]